MEPDEGPAGNGQSTQDWAEKGGECLPDDHEGDHRGENHELAEVQVAHSKDCHLLRQCWHREHAGFFHIQVFTLSIPLIICFQTEGVLDLFSLDSASPTPSANPAGGTGVKAVLDNLPELWAESDYTEEYDMQAFIKSMKPG